MQQEWGTGFSGANRNPKGKTGIPFPVGVKSGPVVSITFLRQYYIYSVFHFLYITPDSRKSICRDQTSRVVQIVTGGKLLPPTYHILKVFRYEAYRPSLLQIFPLQFLSFRAVRVPADCGGNLGVIILSYVVEQHKNIFFSFSILYQNVSIRYLLFLNQFQYFLTATECSYIYIFFLQFYYLLLGCTFLGDYLLS